MGPDFLRTLRQSRPARMWRFSSTGSFSRLSSPDQQQPAPKAATNTGSVLKRALLCVGIFVALSVLLWRLPSGARPFLSRDDELWAPLRRPESLSNLAHTEVPICDITADGKCPFLMVADLDTASRMEGKEEKYQSYLLAGELHWDGNAYSLQIDTQPLAVYGKLNEGGRGMELSELVNFNGQLLAFDDRTGAVFECLSTGQMVPRWILTEGDGRSSVKGMKIEWATAKDGNLFIGSFGKPFTDESGTKVLSEANFWVHVVDGYGRVERRNWKPLYLQLQHRLGVDDPGYLIHEAIRWSSHLQRWVVLPRRVSHEPYNELLDEQRGSNLLLLVTEDFSAIQVLELKLLPTDKTRGFSSFAFVPGTKDRVLIAIRSAEDSAAGTQATFISVVETLTGNVLVNEQMVQHAVKYEGIEFFQKFYA